MNANINLTVRFDNAEKLFDFVEDLKLFCLVPPKTTVREAAALDVSSKNLILYAGGDGRELEMNTQVTRRVELKLLKPTEEEA